MWTERITKQGWERQCSDCELSCEQMTCIQASVFPNKDCFLSFALDYTNTKRLRLTPDVTVLVAAGPWTYRHAVRCCDRSKQLFLPSRHNSHNIPASIAPLCYVGYALTIIMLTVSCFHMLNTFHSPATCWLRTVIQTSRWRHRQHWAQISHLS